MQSWNKILLERRPTITIVMFYKEDEDNNTKSWSNLNIYIQKTWQNEMPVNNAKVVIMQCRYFIINANDGHW